jgi:thiopeptide-type bacteriocin biosynthesis protein
MADTRHWPLGVDHGFEVTMSSPGLPARWLQVNVALQRHDGGARTSARALFGHLARLVADWRQRKILDCFYFMRKAPDVRLRFLGREPEGDLFFELHKVLSGLQHDGFVQRFFPSVYEPEVSQFGGPEAMDHIHSHFDADCTAWIALDLLDASGRWTVPSTVFELALMNDLFNRTLSCRAEVWDVWCNLRSLLPAAQPGPGPVVDIFLAEELLPHLSRAEAHVIEQYLRSNRALASGLLQVWNEGRLQCGLRGLLPFVAMYDFNRHGIDGVAQSAMAHAMSQAWDPKRGMRGAEAEPRST